ncbi:MAG: helix-turn-helix domain-containing protein [Sphingobium limneticum]
MQSWVKLPTAWILDDGLKAFRWEAQRGGPEVAALMLLAIIGHHAEATTGIAKISYDDMTDAAGISRALVSRALDVLIERELIARAPGGRGTWGLVNYDPALGWAKLPARGLYGGATVRAFQNFTLRHRNELFAMKLYFLFAAFRDNVSNCASISYDRIVERTGVPRDGIKAAISTLIINGLLYVENSPSWDARAATGQSSPIYNRYRLTHLDSYRHAGTSGRGEDPFPSLDEPPF